MWDRNDPPRGAQCQGTLENTEKQFVSRLNTDDTHQINVTLNFTSTAARELTANSLFYTFSPLQIMSQGIIATNLLMSHCCQAPRRLLIFKVVAFPQTAPLRLLPGAVCNVLVALRYIQV